MVFDSDKQGCPVDVRVQHHLGLVVVVLLVVVLAVDLAVVVRLLLPTAGVLYLVGKRIFDLMNSGSK